MLLSILIILAGIAVILLAAAIRFGFRFDREIKEVFISYLLVRVAFDFREMNGLVTLVGLKIKKIELAGKQRPAEAKKEMPKKPPKKKKFRRPELAWSDLHLLKSLIKKFHIKYLTLNVSGGFSDPCRTGKCFGIYTAISGILPKIMRHINYHPDFTTDSLQFDGKGEIYVRLYDLVIWAGQVIIKKRKWIFGESLYLRKKGASYA